MNFNWMKKPEESNPCPDCGADRGYYPNLTKQQVVPNVRCFTCEDIAAAKREKEAEEIRARETAVSINDYMRNRGVPELFIGTQIEIPSGKELLDALTGGILGRSLYMYGNVGVGKTTLAVHIMKERILRRLMAPHDAQFRTAATICAYVRDGIDTQNYEHRLTEAAAVPFLLLDDFGAERTTEHNTSVMVSLIAMRYERRLQTIITSNIRSGQILKRYDERTLSRISSMSVIQIKGADRRQREAW